MPIRITPTEYADKQARRLKAATEDIRRGVGRVTESPTAKAAAAQDKMLARLTESVQSGKWAAGLKRVTLEEWKSAMLDKGVNRIAAGIDAAKGKVVAFATELLAYEENLLGKIDAMPDLTLEDSINRSAEWMRGMSRFRRSG